MIFGICLVSCAESKKGEHSKDSEVSKDRVEHNENAAAQDHGYETAMASYQCPMKCEGEKSYQEEGSCPVCKMDLKKVELKPEEAESGKTENTEEGTE